MGRLSVSFSTLSLAGVGVVVGYAGYCAMRFHPARSITSMMGRARVLELRKSPLNKEDVIIGCSSLAGMYQVRICFNDDPVDMKNVFLFFIYDLCPA